MDAVCTFLDLAGVRLRKKPGEGFIVVGMTGLSPDRKREVVNFVSINKQRLKDLVASPAEDERRFVLNEDGQPLDRPPGAPLSEPTSSRPGVARAGRIPEQAKGTARNRQPFTQTKAEPKAAGPRAQNLETCIYCTYWQKRSPDAMWCFGRCGLDGVEVFNNERCHRGIRAMW